MIFIRIWDFFSNYRLANRKKTTNNKFNDRSKAKEGYLLFNNDKIEHVKC